MTKEEKEYEGESYRLRLLKRIGKTAESIDDKVDDILEELREHLPEIAGYRDEWSPRDLYDDRRYP